jgi:CubicO group peptidase (beta-lactamase class C family)
MSTSGPSHAPRPDAAAAALLRRALSERLFPAAVAEVGDSTRILWREAFGAHTFDAGAPPATDNTVFDLASLTKPIAATSVLLRLADARRVVLEDRVSSHFGEWRGSDRDTVTVQDLLEHTSGLSARLVDAPPEGRREFEHEICGMALEYVPRTRSIYSDLGFILLGFLAADRGGSALSTQFDAVVKQLPDPDAGLLAYGVPPHLIADTAPTLPMDEDVRRGRRLLGEVHDNYAWMLGGVAGHAGLFGTAGGVGRFARAVLRSARGDTSKAGPLSPALVARATRKTDVPGSSRALGWDTMLPTSSCGTRLSPSAFGHTGFTGTSLWIDPVFDRYFVLLTNRACGGGTPEELQRVRRAFHDAAASL